MSNDTRDVCEILGEWLDDDYPTVGEVATIRRTITELRSLRDERDRLRGEVARLKRDGCYPVPRIDRGSTTRTIPAQGSAPGPAGDSAP